MKQFQAPQGRFTILCHTVGQGFARDPDISPSPIAAGEVHWDWLFTPFSAGHAASAGPLRIDPQPSERLWTWATDPPGSNPKVLTWEETLPIALPAIRLPDHRVLYLDYEGPISRNRGTVMQVATGVFEPLTAEFDTASEFPQRIRGILRLPVPSPLRKNTRGSHAQIAESTTNQSVPIHRESASLHSASTEITRAICFELLQRRCADASSPNSPSWTLRLESVTAEDASPTV